MRITTGTIHSALALCAALTLSSGCVDDFSEAETEEVSDTPDAGPTGAAPTEGATETTGETEVAATDTDPAVSDATDVGASDGTDPGTDVSDAGPGVSETDDAGPTEGTGDSGTGDSGTDVTPEDTGDGGDIPDAGGMITCDPECAGNTPHCVNGACVACLDDEVSCNGRMPLSCGDDGQWVEGDLCLGALCIDGQCQAPSCVGLADDCGALANDSCCASPLVPGGEFLRDENPDLHVSVSDYRLDKYEVTVGRFRKFLEAVQDGWQPTEGIGAYPRAPDSGWDPSWGLTAPSLLQEELKCLEDQYTWTDDPGNNENRPVNCVNWFEAFAFCAWDGGYLPTDAQWEYAAAGGNEQRYYPWSEPPTSSEIGLDYSTYFCAVEPITEACFNPVGTKPLGDGKYGQADLGGNVREWLHDDYGDDPYACPSGVNCLYRETGATARLMRGGSAGSSGTAPVVVATGYDYWSATTRFAIHGFRCARPVPDDFVDSPDELPGENTECTPGEMECNDAVPVWCDDSGKWAARDECEFACVAGTCTECTGDTRGCEANVPLACGTDGFWRQETACSGDTPVCADGECVGICAQRNDCGPAGNESCCQSLALPGGTFDRRNDPELPATVSAFDLEKYEVTVGRFREFVDAYPSSLPGAGDGAHPSIADSGWQEAWNAEMPESRDELIDLVMTVGSSACGGPTVFTYTPEAGPNEARAVNCLSWYEAFAFCAWTGGRLPTLAELSFAQVGGSEQRVYPWSDPATSTQIDSTYATYDANECPANTTDNSSCISIAGSKPAGNGRWGHADLAGNVGEYVMDLTSTPPATCVDCAVLGEGSHAVLGGAYDFDTELQLQNGTLRGSDGRSKLAGIRCVRPTTP